MRHEPEMISAAAALGDRFACDLLHERQALEEILKNPKNRNIQKWASRRYLEITEENQK